MDDAPKKKPVYPISLLMQIAQLPCPGGEGHAGSHNQFFCFACRRDALKRYNGADLPFDK